MLMPTHADAVVQSGKLLMQTNVHKKLTHGTAFKQCVIDTFIFMFGMTNSLG